MTTFRYGHRRYSEITHFQYRPIRQCAAAAGSREQGRRLSWLDNERWRADANRAQANPSPGLASMTLLLSQDRSADQRLVAAFLRSALVTVPMLLILIGLAGWLIAQNGLRPLRKFRALATKVSTQDLSPRIRNDRLPQELQALAHSLNVMLHRLDDGVQQLSQFSDDVAHELKTPLNNLIGKAQVTLVRERSKEHYREVIESSVEELERMDRIVSDMLFLAQASHASPALKLEQLSLGSEARRVCEYFEVLAEEAGVATTVTGDAMILEIDLWSSGPFPTCYPTRCGIQILAVRSNLRSLRRT
ncbi:histidine kinase dimerization/phospho-acceptor domain-containing protein [Halopseudomonas pachastrellae]|nr:histidine kinase dimerization/phospho-acceptor domain-containing protein [Halopseudomonas pachastrellae]